MARAAKITREELPKPELKITRDEAELRITEQITKGKGIFDTPISNRDELETTSAKHKKWHDYNRELLETIFTNGKIAKEYTAKSSLAVFSMTPQHFYEDVDDFRRSVQRRLTSLESILERLPLFSEASRAQKPADNDSTSALSSLLHPTIRKECLGLVKSGYYGEAVERSFKIVRDRLRALTGYETSSDAFGKGNLFIRGAAASNVEHDFQDAVKFLGMSIDFFRNEKAHTTTANVPNRNRAYQYLAISSVALQHLDQGEIRNPN